MAPSAMFASEKLLQGPTEQSSSFPEIASRRVLPCLVVVSGSTSPSSTVTNSLLVDSHRKRVSSLASLQPALPRLRHNLPETSPFASSTRRTKTFDNGSRCRTTPCCSSSRVVSTSVRSCPLSPACSTSAKVTSASTPNTISSVAVKCSSPMPRSRPPSKSLDASIPVWLCKRTRVKSGSLVVSSTTSMATARLHSPSSRASSPSCRANLNRWSSWRERRRWRPWRHRPSRAQPHQSVPQANGSRF
mmetsp:Transcript_57405/g.135101  ORF Transcript_57405/g.135101 Transcript_57405/m.135101 type:complete len:246 (-) Transcript_57405:1804-2541(-)